MSIICWTYKGY